MAMATVALRHTRALVAQRGVRVLAAHAHALHRSSSSVLPTLRSVAGAVRQLASDSTAPAHRPRTGAEYLQRAAQRRQDPALEKASRLGTRTWLSVALYGVMAPICGEKKGGGGRKLMMVSPRPRGHLVVHVVLVPLEDRRALNDAEWTESSFPKRIRVIGVHYNIWEPLVGSKVPRLL